MKLEFELPENVTMGQAVRHFGFLFAEELEKNETNLIGLKLLLDDTRGFDEKSVRDIELSVRNTTERIALYKVVLETMCKGEFK